MQKGGIVAQFCFMVFQICIAMKFYEGSIGDKMARLKGGRLPLSDVLRYSGSLHRIYAYFMF